MQVQSQNAVIAINIKRMIQSAVSVEVLHINEQTESRRESKVPVSKLPFVTLISRLYLP